MKNILMTTLLAGAALAAAAAPSYAQVTVVLDGYRLEAKRVSSVTTRRVSSSMELTRILVTLTNNTMMNVDVPFKSTGFYSGPVYATPLGTPGPVEGPVGRMIEKMARKVMSESSLPDAQRKFDKLIFENLWVWHSLTNAYRVHPYSSVVLNVKSPVAVGSSGARGGLVSLTAFADGSTTLGGNTFRAWGKVILRRTDHDVPCHLLRDGAGIPVFPSLVAIREAFLLNWVDFILSSGLDGMKFTSVHSLATADSSRIVHDGSVLGEP